MDQKRLQSNLIQFLKSENYTFIGLRDMLIENNKVYLSVVLQDLDELPIPAWDMLPLEKYWEISRPHGGGFSDRKVAYASAMFSRGCPFRCAYCHISKETTGSDSGNIITITCRPTTYVNIIT